MRIKELIEQLQKLPPDMQVMVESEPWDEPAMLIVMEDDRHGSIALLCAGPSNSDI